MRKLLLMLLVLGAASGPAFAQAHFYDIPKAAVQFDGVVKPASYVWSGTSLIVTTNSQYGFRSGDHVFVSFTNSTINGYYEITSVSGRSLTLANTRSGSGSGAANVRVWTKAALNIRSVVAHREADLDWPQGVFEIYFDTPFVDDRYIAVGGTQYWRTEKGLHGGPPRPNVFYANFYQADGSRDSPDYVPFVFFGTLVGE